MADSELSSTLQSWLHYREFGQGSVQAPVTEKERSISWLIYMQKAFFVREVELEKLSLTDENPPQSLKDILEERMTAIETRQARSNRGGKAGSSKPARQSKPAKAPKTSKAPRAPRQPRARLTGLSYRDAIRNGWLAGMLMGIVLAVMFLILSAAH